MVKMLRLKGVETLEYNTSFRTDHWQRIHHRSLHSVRTHIGPFSVRVEILISKEHSGGSVDFFHNGWVQVWSVGRDELRSSVYSELGDVVVRGRKRKIESAIKLDVEDLLETFRCIITESGMVE